MTFAEPPRWSAEQFDQQLTKSLDIFREERLRESTEQYVALFESCAARFTALMADTHYLLHLHDRSQAILANPDQLEALRYLAGPPISADDLKTLANSSLSSRQLREDPAAVARIVAIVLASLDPMRFPWVSEQRVPNEIEVRIAATASAGLLVTQRIQSERRNRAKYRQEQELAEYLGHVGLHEVEPREISTHGDAPQRGSFCRECLFGGRKADIVIQLDDGRLLPIECKVSNSATNSVKRLNNDAAAKAAAWIAYFGRGQTVPIAVLSGVFKRNNLLQAQQAGLTIFWAHDLSTFGDFIKISRSD